MKKAKHAKSNKGRKKARGTALKKAPAGKAGSSEIIRVALACAQKQVGRKTVAVVRAAKKKTKGPCRHVGRQVGEITEAESARMAKLLEAGKLRVRRAPDGKVIPDDQDYLEVEREHPKKSLGAKLRLAQASALLRALRQYDEGQARTH